jgi:hypothetical protein
MGRRRVRRRARPWAGFVKPVGGPAAANPHVRFERVPPGVWNASGTAQGRERGCWSRGACGLPERPGGAITLSRLDGPKQEQIIRSATPDEV